MNRAGITPRIIVWQQLLAQAQALAARLPGMGLDPDKLALLPFDDLVGVLAFLNQLKTEKKT